MWRGSPVGGRFVPDVDELAVAEEGSSLPFKTGEKVTEGFGALKMASSDDGFSSLISSGVKWMLKALLLKASALSHNGMKSELRFYNF